MDKVPNITLSRVSDHAKGNQSNSAANVTYSARNSLLKTK